MKELQGIEQFEDFTEEETKQIAKVFEDGLNHPLQATWNKILKKKLQGYYYRLAHSPISITIDQRMEQIARISGHIAELEILINTPKDFIDAVKREEENE